MALWTIKAGEKKPLIGGAVDRKRYAEWLRHQVEAADHDQKAKEAQPGWPYTEDAVAMVARSRAVHAARNTWLEMCEAEWAGKPGSHLANFERGLCAGVIGDAGAHRALKEMISEGRADTNHDQMRLTITWMWSCRILAEYTGLDWQKIKACGESQEAVEALLASRVAA